MVLGSRSKGLSHDFSACQTRPLAPLLSPIDPFESFLLIARGMFARFRAAACTDGAAVEGLVAMHDHGFALAASRFASLPKFLDAFLSHSSLVVHRYFEDMQRNGITCSTISRRHTDGRNLQAKRIFDPLIRNGICRFFLLEKKHVQFLAIDFNRVMTRQLLSVALPMYAWQTLWSHYWLHAALAASQSQLQKKTAQTQCETQLIEIDPKKPQKNSIHAHARQTKS